MFRSALLYNFRVIKLGRFRIDISLLLPDGQRSLSNLKHVREHSVCARYCRDLGESYRSKIKQGRGKQLMIAKSAFASIRKASADPRTENN